MKHIYLLVILTSILIYTTTLAAQINDDPVYREPMPSLAINFDPQKMIDGYSFEIAYQIYDTLFQVDDFLQVQPHLVSAWQTTDNGRKYVLNLKTGIRFHDDTLLSSNDVIFTIERFVKKYPKRYQELTYIIGVDKFLQGTSEHIDGLRKTSESSLEIILKEPVNTLPLILSSPNLSILPKKIFEKSEVSFFEHPIGTGPFKVSSFSMNRSLELKRNENYFLEKPKLEKIVFEFATKQKAIEGFNKGIYHDLLWYNPSIEDIKTSYNVAKFPIPSVTLLVFNTKRHPFNKLAARNYVLSHIDRDKLYSRCFSNNIKANNFIPYGFGGHELTPPDSYDKAPLPSNAKIDEFTILRMENHPCHDKFDATVKELFSNTKTRAKITYVTYQDFVTNYNPVKNYDIIELTLYPDYPEALSLLDYFRTASENNYAAFSSSKYDSLVKMAMTTTDKQERYKIYKNAEKILYDEAVVMPIYYNMESIIFNKSVKGMKNPALMLSALPLRFFYFEE